MNVFYILRVNVFLFFSTGDRWICVCLRYLCFFVLDYLFAGAWCVWVFVCLFVYEWLMYLHVRLFVPLFLFICLCIKLIIYVFACLAAGVVFTFVCLPVIGVFAGLAATYNVFVCLCVCWFLTGHGYVCMFGYLYWWLCLYVYFLCVKC